MNSHRAGSGTTVTSGTSDSNNAPMSNSVIQTNSHNAVVTSQPGGPTAMREAAVTFNGNNNATGSAVVAQHPASVSHLIKAEAPKTIVHSAQHQGLTPRSSTASSPGAVRTLATQMLVPRLTQGSPRGQPNIQNIQLPPGMVLVRSESGQLLMIHQQALAQMQAQGSMAPRPANPTNLPPVQVPGNPIISRQVVPSNIIRHASSAATTISPITAHHHHRHPVLQRSVGAALPGTGPQPASTATSATVSNETMENVKKCRNFLSTLIKLASNGEQSSETAANVKELVKDLLEGRLEAAEFTDRLYKELNSSPQPSLVPFLKRNLPALRQLTSDATSFIQQSQLTQPAPAAPASTSSPISSTVTLSSPGPRFAAQMTRAQIQPGLSKPGQTTQMSTTQVLQAQQQGAMLRPQVSLTTTPMASLRNQAPSHILLGQQQVQMKPLPSVRPVATPAFRPIPPAALSPALKIKLKDAGSTFKDDDDINDVASMAGVNLSEETARILATNSELVGAVTRSCKDEVFLHTSMLQRRMLEIGRRFGVMELGGDVITYVSHATQQRIQNLVETVSQVAQQKNSSFKEEGCYEQSGDVRAQLRFFEQLDHLEKQRKEEQEREILLKAAKSRARQEDPEQLRLKQKAKEMQQQELAQMRQREANMTALAAIGPRKKRRLLDSPSSAAAAEGVGSSLSLSGGAGLSGSRPMRQRVTRINLRDLLFCLENERFSRRSHFLYKGFLK